MRSQLNRTNLLSRAIVAATFVVALGGFTEGSCFGSDQDGETCGDITCAAGERCIELEVVCATAPCPPILTCASDPQPSECFSDADCGDDSYCDFEGAFPEGYEPDPTNCIALSGVCRPITTCASNADCGLDEHCAYDSATRCDAECPPGADCRCGGGASLTGTCEPGPAECFSDSDCPSGSYCPAVPMYDCGGICPEGEPCPYDCGGSEVAYCEPLPTDCGSDADCTPDHFCNLGTSSDPDDYCDCGPNGDCYCGSPAPGGTCEPRHHPGECETDADCGPGASCSFLEAPCPADPATGEPGCWQQIGVCVSDPSDECQSDADCRAGELCNYYEVDCLCAGSAGEPCDCGAPVGFCEPAPGEGCLSDSDCPGGFCESFDTCMAIGCPPAPANACVYPSCNDGGPTLCDMIPPTCAAGQVAAARNGCWECVDARTCGNEPPDACWGAWTDEAGACRSANDGTLPPECCDTACRVDADCGESASCWDGLCVDTDSCSNLTEWECQANDLCAPLYGPSHCDPASGVCTADEGFISCSRAP